uniref:Sterile alpha motif domain containing 7 n=1 Tax=Pseudonaja textilis TaxID=8673 RepID=A0A670Z608_PSETE
MMLKVIFNYVHSFIQLLGYSFLQSESMEAVAKRQELVQKQNMARMEMSAIFQQKELEKAQRKSLLKLRGFSPYPDVPACSPSFQERHYIPEGHLSNGLYSHQTTLNELQRNATLMGTSSYPPLTMLQRERVRRPSRRAGIRKASRYQFNHGKYPREDRDTDLASVTLSEEKNDKKESKTSLLVAKNKNDFPQIFLAPPRRILNGEEISSAEDIRKWTVEDVYSFINSLPGCSDYAQVFKDHVIDGETLPLLTEEHLLDMMGLKLGPALKIQSQVYLYMGFIMGFISLLLLSGTGSSQLKNIIGPGITI